MIDQHAIISNVSKTAVIGTAIVFFVNLACYGVGILVGAEPHPNDITYFLTIGLGVLAVVDIFAGYILKRKLMAPLFFGDAAINEAVLSQIAMRTTIVVAVLCSAPPVYGLITVVFGGDPQTMIGFVMVSLAGFLLLRLRPRDFKSLTCSE